MKNKTVVTIRNQPYNVVTTEGKTVLQASKECIAVLDTFDEDDSAVAHHNYWVNKLTNEQPLFVRDKITNKDILL